MTEERAPYEGTPYVEPRTGKRTEARLDNVEDRINAISSALMDHGKRINLMERWWRQKYPNWHSSEKATRPEDV